jgi:hypothetical protein
MRWLALRRKQSRRKQSRDRGVPSVPKHTSADLDHQAPEWLKYTATNEDQWARTQQWSAG